MTEATPHRDRWMAYFQSECDGPLATFQESYPESRSFVIDLLDIYEFDKSLLQAVFETPMATFRDGRETLREITGVSGVLYLRPENNPHQQRVDGIGARHIHELVTVDGVVESLGDRRVKVRRAVYRCQDCGQLSRRSVVGIDGDPPERCEHCPDGGSLEVQPSESTFVDIQQCRIAAQSAPGSESSSLPAYLEDDLVGEVRAGDRCLVTGILCAAPGDHSAIYRPYLDARAISTEYQTAPDQDISDVLDAVWTR